MVKEKEAPQNEDKEGKKTKKSFKDTLGALVPQSTSICTHTKSLSLGRALLRLEATSNKGQRHRIRRTWTECTRG